MHHSPAEEKLLRYMVSVLEFRWIEWPKVSFPRTVQTFAAYEQLRQRGLRKPEAIYHLLYD